MSLRLLLIYLLVISSCQKRIGSEDNHRGEVSIKNDSVKKDKIVPSLDTISTTNKKNSGSFVAGEPCFTVSPKEVGNKIDSSVKVFNGLRCFEGDSNVVFIEFLVDSLGNASRFKVIKSLCPKLNNTALKIVSSAKFEPARCGEQKIQMRMTYKLTF